MAYTNEQMKKWYEQKQKDAENSAMQQNIDHMRKMQNALSQSNISTLLGQGGSIGAGGYVSTTSSGTTTIYPQAPTVHPSRDERLDYLEGMMNTMRGEAMVKDAEIRKKDTYIAQLRTEVMIYHAMREFLANCFPDALKQFREVQKTKERLTK